MQLKSEYYLLGKTNAELL